MNTQIHTEKTFEEAIENSLIEVGGYAKGGAVDFDMELAIERNRIIAGIPDSINIRSGYR